MHFIPTSGPRLEIEMSATVRDALAEKLIKIAARHGKTPVDLFADMTERAIGEDWFGRPPAAPTEAVPAKLEAVNRQLADARRQLRECREAMAGEGCLILSGKTLAGLQAEADRRTLDLNVLAFRILELAVEDNLFSAVLDG